VSPSYPTCSVPTFLHVSTVWTQQWCSYEGLYKTDASHFSFLLNVAPGYSFLPLPPVSDTLHLHQDNVCPQSITCVQNITGSKYRIFWRYVPGREWWLNSLLWKIPVR
jgi:hypothetical protein